jgi:DNA-binding transcriptional regulator LsrR (DeoR family)
MRKNKQPARPLDVKIQRITALLEQLIAVQMYRGGATQPEIAMNLGIAVGKVNKLIKGVKSSKHNDGEK